MSNSAPPQVQTVTLGPSSGNLIHCIKQCAKTEAPVARTDGQWVRVCDARGNCETLGIHGVYHTRPSLLSDALSTGDLTIYQHSDQKLHLNDIADASKSSSSRCFQQCFDS